MNSTILGYVGSLLILFAYSLLICNKLKSVDLSYLFMSVTGCILVGINCYVLNAYPSVIVNIAFALIPIVYFVNYRIKNKRNNYGKRV